MLTNPGVRADVMREEAPGGRGTGRRCSEEDQGEKGEEALSGEKASEGGKRQGEGQREEVRTQKGESSTVELMTQGTSGKSRRRERSLGE
ncbi:hypothetical protein NDU88_001074 [Pleurodeles waltl]|uniref:Uncharacterized protein n=1 Tax=Pleurodeles waltl TaxID=8319 RepID=A0AAV7TGU7_PLEWA|nr:hypothetical protein NDU88_001074 [Pleurodeles waltl]